MVNFYRPAVGIIYFCQFFLLLYFYKKTKDGKILHDTVKETPLLVICRSVWAAAVICSITLYLIFPALFAWADLDLLNGIRTFGILIGIGANLLILWILVSLGTNISAALKVRDNQHLVTTGTYKYIRHPLYTAGLFLFCSITLTSANWFLGFLGIGFQLFIMCLRTPLEEEMLIEHFGDEYRQYIKRTGAFFPKLLVNRRNIP